MNQRECNINNIVNYIKKARQKAVLGDYISSLELYKTAIKVIQNRYDKELSDKFLINKWKKIEEVLKTECTSILEICDICKIFQKEDYTNNIDLQNQYANQILMRDYKANKKKEIPDEIRWKHFGGQKPFTFTNNNNNDNVNENMFYDDFYQFRPKYKDPDVWDPPEDMPKKIIRRRSEMPKKNVPKSVGSVFNNEQLEKKRNYDKPWKVPEVVGKKSSSSQKPGKNKKDEQSGINKSEFLLARYPDDNGNGPDSDLVNMIEMDILTKNPDVSLSDIAGLDSAKKALQEAVILPLLFPEYFKGLRRPWKGVLLYGPPGTGKTLLAKALATQGKTKFFNVSSTTFASKWRGESERLVRLLFEMARFYGPSTIFIDEIDSVGGKRTEGDNEASRRVMSEMLIQMDGVSSQITPHKTGENAKDDNKSEDKPKNVMVLGATNHPWDIDDALRRRFEKRIYIPLPNTEGRMKMFDINLKDINLDDNINFDELVKLTEGYSGADIANVCREASLMQMRRALNTGEEDYNNIDANKIEQLKKDLENAKVTMKDIKTAISNISKTVSKNDLKRYEEWTKEFANQ